MLLLFHIHLHNLYHYYQEVLHPQLFPHYWLGLPPLLSFLPSGQVGKTNCSTGGYFSDAHKNALDLLYDQLAAVFRSWLYHGTVTPSLLAC